MARSSLEEADMVHPIARIVTFHLLISGAGVAAGLASSWESIYCHLFLDPALVGRWEGGRWTGEPWDEWFSLTFDRLGNVTGIWERRNERANIFAMLPQKPPPPRRVSGEYRIDNGWLRFEWSHGKSSAARYHIRGDNLVLRLTDTRSQLLTRVLQSRRR